MKKVYAVRTGKKTGIFYDWDEVESYVSGFPGAEYKGFKSENEAHRYLYGESEQLSFEENDSELIAYVDGSFSTELNKYSYGVVLICNNKVIDELSGIGKSEDATSIRNVAGELLGTTTAIKYALSNNYSKITIYHDYEGIAKWAENEWKANSIFTKAYKEYINKVEEKIEISFVKVDAHTGVEYNERADKLAKEILEKFKKDIDN